MIFSPFFYFTVLTQASIFVETSIKIRFCRTDDSVNWDRDGGERERARGEKKNKQETSESNARPRVLPERNAAFLPWNPCTRARTWTSRRFQVSMKTSNYPV